MWKKQCPICKADQIYKSERTYSNSLKVNALCKQCSNTKKAVRNGDCSVLLQDNIITYYWIGFILADGHIYNRRRLKVSLGTKDTAHLLKLANFLKLSNVREYPKFAEISVMDSINIQKFSAKFKIEQNKTIKACNISFVKGTLLKALIIGFIDGDGFISKQYKRDSCFISIKCHKAWKDNLDIFSQFLLKRKQSYINKRGYVVLNIGTMKIIQDLKRFIINENIPVLERKWKLVKLIKEAV